MSHVDPVPGPLSVVALPTLRELVGRFDSALGRPPFTVSQQLLDAANELLVGLSTCAPKDLLIKDVCETLPIVATSLPLGFASSPGGFVGARPLVLILCECLRFVAQVARFPLLDFLRAARTHFPDSKEVVRLHHAAGAIDESAVRHFLHLHPPPQGATPAARTARPSTKGKKSGGGGSAASTSVSSNGSNTAPCVKPAPEVVAALCNATLDAASRKLLMQQFDSAAKFCTLVGANAEVALAILDVFGSHLVQQLKPPALIPCMGVATASAFVTLLDCHASSLAVLLDDVPSNPFRGMWCPAECAADILCAISKEGSVVDGRTESFGFLVAVSLWLRPLAFQVGIEPRLSCDCLAAILRKALRAVSVVARQPGSQQQWLLVLSVIIEYVCELAPHGGSASFDEVVLDAWPALSVLLLAVLEANPSTVGNRAPSATVSKPSRHPPTSVKGKKAPPAGAAAAATSKDAGGVATVVVIMDAQSTAIRVLEVTKRLQSLCLTSLQDGVSRIAEQVVGLVDTPRRELLEGIASFVVAMQQRCDGTAVGSSPVLVQQLIAWPAGGTVVCSLVRNRCHDAARLVGLICQAATRWTSQEKEAHDATLVRIVHAAIDAIVCAQTSAQTAWQLLDAIAILAGSGDTLFDTLRRHLTTTPTASEVVLGHIEAMARSDGERFSNLLAVCTVVGRALEEAKSAAAASLEASNAQRVDAARKKAEALEVQRQAHRAEQKALRDKSLKAQERQQKLSNEAQQRLASAAGNLAREVEERQRATAERVAALREQARQLKVAREEQLKTSVKAYRERSAHTRNVAVFLQSLGIGESRALTIARSLHPRLKDCTHSHVLEYVVTGSLSLPQDLKFPDDTTTADGAAAAIFVDSGLGAATVSTASTGVSFWDQVMSDVRAEEYAHVGAVEQHDQDIGSSPADKQALSFHFRIAPLLDLFSFDECGDQGSHHTSIAVRQVKQALERSDVEGGRPVFVQYGFEDAMHVVFTAQERGLVWMEGGRVTLTVLGHAYHAPYWNRMRSFARVLEDRRVLAQQVLQNAARQQEESEQRLYDSGADFDVEDSDCGDLFDDTLM